MPRTECEGGCGRPESECACPQSGGVCMDLDSYDKGYRICTTCGEEFPQDELYDGLCVECEKEIMI